MSSVWWAESLTFVYTHFKCTIEKFVLKLRQYLSYIALYYSFGKVVSNLFSEQFIQILLNVVFWASRQQMNYNNQSFTLVFRWKKLLKTWHFSFWNNRVGLLWRNFLSAIFFWRKIDPAFLKQIFKYHTSLDKKNQLVDPAY